jgi:hypothetical protein
VCGVTWLGLAESRDSTGLFVSIGAARSASSLSNCWIALELHLNHVETLITQVLGQMGGRL